jgi:hypothetical protein
MNTKIIFSISLLVVTHLAISQNIFEENHTTKTIPIPTSYQTPIAAGNGTDGSISIKSIDNGQKILTSLYGNNASSWMGKKILTDDVRKKHLKNVNVTYMRFPGGNSSNNYFWDGNIPASTKADKNYNPVSGTDNAWRLSLDGFLGLCDTLGNESVMCVNASYARYGNGTDPIKDAAHYAAEFVRYVNIIKGKNVRYWEIGNENYGPWQAGYLVEGDTIDGAKYAAIFNMIADSMKAADPTIKVGAVAVEVDSEKNGGYNWWNKQLMPNCIQKADFWITHQYFVYDNKDWNNITVDEILNSTHLVKESIENVQTSVAKYTSHQGDYLPVAMTEYNLRGGEKEVAMVSALFIAECLGEFIANNYGLVMLWDMQNGTKKSGTDGPGGDHGFYSWNDSSLPNGTPRPSFFVYYYAQKYLGHQGCDVTVVGDSLKSFASIDNNGNVGVVVINQSNLNKSVTMESENNAPATWHWHSIHADSKTSKKFMINGATTNLYTEGGPTDYSQIQPFGIEKKAQAVINLPANSVNFIVYKKSVITSINTIAKYDIIFPNPTTGSVSWNEIGYYRVTNQSGKEVLQGYGTSADLNQLSAGVYFILIDDKKFTVQKL